MLLAKKRRAVALRAVEFPRQLRPGRRGCRRGLLLRRRHLLAGEIGREVVHIHIRQVGGERRHLRVFAVARPELEELCRDRLRRLARYRGHGWRRRVATFAMARHADLRLGAACFDVGRGGVGTEKKKRGGRSHRAVPLHHFL